MFKNKLNYYQILGVNVNSSHIEIKQAYLKLIKDFHPDLNPNKKDAKEMSQLLNEAYSILSDPKKKYQYDLLNNFDIDELEPENEYEKYSENDKETIENLKVYSCDSCKLSNSTLKVTAFLYVISLIFVTNKDAKVKILCSKCRIKYSLLWNLEVWFLGWWGFPYGPIYSIEALFKNSTGGIDLKSNNLSLLKYQTYVHYKNGNYLEAYRNLKEKIRLEKTEEDVVFLNYLKQFVSLKEKKSIYERIINLPLYIFNIPFILILIYGTWFVLFSSSSTKSTDNKRRYEFTGLENEKKENVDKNESKNNPPIINKKEVETFQPKEVTLPQNGRVKYFTKKKPIAPLHISTKSDLNYYVKLMDNNTNTLVQTIFIRSGNSVKVRVPLGSYYVKYAMGGIWYGEEYLFGKYTTYAKADAIFDFKIIGNQVTGYTLELFRQLNGNLETEYIDESEF